MRPTLLSCILAFALVAWLGAPARAADAPLDILIVYTNQADQWHGVDGVESHAQLAVASANEAFANSNAGVRLRLAGVRKVSYSEKSTMAEDLRALTNKDGAMDEIHTWRNEIGADLVCLFRAQYAGEIIGTAWLLDDTGGDADRAFSVVSMDYALSDLVLQHEVGHNLGAAHDRDNSDDGGLYSYSYGHRFTVSGGWQVRTVMAYDPGYQINYFSNPSIRYEGAPTGVASGSSSADNARTIRNVASAVSAYRAHKHQPPIARAGEDVIVEDADGDGNETVALDASASFTEDGIASAAWTWAGGSASGVSATASFSVGERIVTLTVTDREGAKSTDTLNVSVVALSPVAQVYAGFERSFLLRESGTVVAFGHSGYGGDALGLDGLGRLLEPRLVPVSRVSKIAVGSDHTLFLKLDGTVYSTGANGYGQLGSGGTAAVFTPKPALIEGVVDIAAFSQGSVFLKADGSVWGSGRVDTLQLGPSGGASHSTPVKLIDGGVKAVVAGEQFIAMLHEDGSVTYAGSISGTYMGSEPPARRPFESGVVAIAAGWSHLVVLKSDGSVWAVGNGQNGQLGPPIYATLTPVQIAPSGAKAIAAALRGTAVYMQDGSTWVVGESFDKLFGLRQLPPPRTLQQASEGRIVSMAGGQRLLLLRGDGSAWTVTLDIYGAVATGLLKVAASVASVANAPPVARAGPDIATSDAFGNGGSKALLDARLSTDDWFIAKYRWTWPGGAVEGSAAQVQFPIGVTVVTLEVVDDDGAKHTDTLEVRVGPFVGAASVATAGTALYVVKRDGSLWAFGSNADGELGPSRNEPEGEFRQLMNGVAGVVATPGGTLARKTDGSLWAAGKAIFNPGIVDKFNFERVASGDAAQAALSASNLAYVKTDGSLWAAGGNQFGQLGFEDPAEFRSEPIMLRASGVAQVACHDQGTIALLEDGSVIGLGLVFGVAAGEWSELWEGGIERIAVSEEGVLVALTSEGKLQAMSLSPQTVAEGFGSSVALAKFHIPGARAVADFAAEGGKLVVATRAGAIEGAGWRQYMSDERQYAWQRVADAGFVAVDCGRRIAVALGEDGSVWAALGTFRPRGGQYDARGGTFARLLPGEEETARANQPPVARAGADRALEDLGDDGFQFFVLDGSASTDDRFVDEWHWSWTDGAANGRVVEAIFPKGRTVVTLTARDHEGQESTDTMTINVVDAAPIGAVYADRRAIFYRTGSGRLYVTSATRPEISGALSSGWRSGDGERLVAENALSVAPGESHGLIVGMDGSLTSYGANEYGQLGRGDCGYNGMPSRAIGGGVVAAAVGTSHSLALMSDGSVWGAGDNQRGQLALPSSAIAPRFERLLEGGVAAIAAGDGFSIFVMGDGSAWYAGRDLERDEYSEPNDAPDLRLLWPSGVADVRAYYASYYLTLVDGSLLAGGSNVYGWLGFDQNSHGYLAKPRLTMTEAQEVFTGLGRTFVLRRDGSLWGMGSGGLGLSAGSYSPRRALGGGVHSFAVSDSVAVAIRSDGAVFATGSLDQARYVGRYLPSTAGWTEFGAGDGSWANKAPVASPSGSLIAFASGESAYVSFADGGSTDDWALADWRWSSSAGYNYGSGPSQNFRLPVGLNEVTLEVEDTDGETARKTLTVSVRPIEDYIAWLSPYIDGQEIWWSEYAPDEDLDGDGFSNQAEFLLGRDPTDPGDRAQLAIELDSAGFALRVWPAMEASGLRVWLSDGLDFWQEIDVSVEWGQESARIPVDPDRRAFYKVAQER